jgi:hypothetical protein
MHTFYVIAMYCSIPARPIVVQARNEVHALRVAEQRRGAAFLDHGLVLVFAAPVLTVTNKGNGVMELSK